MIGLLFAILQVAGSGGILPATCSTGDAFYLHTIIAPSGWFNCTAQNTWTQRNPGGLAATNDLSDVASASTALSNLGGEPAGAYSGIGTCGANQWASTLNDGSAPTCTQPGFSSLSGSATDAQIPGTITIDDITQIANRAISDTTGTLAVSRGGAGAAPSAGDQLLVADSTSSATWRSLGDCTGAGKALTYTASSNTFGCNSISGGGPTYVVLSANRTTATTAYADITDLVIPVAANTRYDIECRISYAANATTTGIGIGWTGPTSPTFTVGQMIAPLTTTTVGGTNSVGNDTGSVTTSSALATAGNAATFKGIWSNGPTAGNVQMRMKSEIAIANAIVIQAGSFCKYNTF